MRIAPRRYDDERDLAEIDRRLERAPDAVDLLFERACCLEDLGQSETAAQAYVAVLGRDSRHLGTLSNLGTMLLHRGEALKAQTFFIHALTHHPLQLITHVNLGQALYEQGEIASAIGQYRAALAVDAHFFAAHQALAILYEATGDAVQSEHHWQAAFENGAASKLPYAGPIPPPLRLLLVVSGRGGDVVAHRFLDDHAMETTMVMADGFRSGTTLPPHDVVFNGIGDADRCKTPLERTRTLLRSSPARVINDPDRVLATGRAGIAERFGSIAGVLVPRTELTARSEITAERLVERGWTFPLLVRVPGYQAGRYFELVKEPDALADALTRLPGNKLLLIAFVDARSGDGYARKYRVLFIDGRLYPVHLAISAEWKVHYFSSDMAERADHRDEERRFLSDMPATLGAPVVIALEEIGRALGLDYGGVDFGIDAAGNVIVFEANATMAVYPPPSGAQWAYRKPAYKAVIAAVRALIVARAVP
jgi:Tfp pilus assembly protein PilF/glutathione synthase/RimK-type ligase-like ATP-grasp enzyme